ncbi:MAG TPA: ATP-binding cassette domain-containing protein [Thermoleophilaceae bacterium]|nr:ATP-binding cassette domain-containing protein [Thermoleophilaceae bacterium]
MARGEPILVIEGLGRSFGEHDVVGRLDLEVEPGERVALLGANGSGKSTVLRCVAGTLAPSRGRALIGGHEAGAREARSLIGVSLSQERSFSLRVSGRENLLFFARLRGYGRRGSARTVDGLAEELEIEHVLSERADRCSTGMILQLAFARALLGDPPLLLLDEPTRSLDTAAVARLWAALDRRRETAVLIATHREDDVERSDSSVALPL